MLAFPKIEIQKKEERSLGCEIVQTMMLQICRDESLMPLKRCLELICSHPVIFNDSRKMQKGYFLIP